MFWWMFQSSPMNWFIYLFILLFLIMNLLKNVQFKKNKYNINFKNYIIKKKYVK